MSFVDHVKRTTKIIPALAGDTGVKGDLFESYVVNRLFPEHDYSLLHATTRRDDLDGRRIESALNPDLHFKHRRSGHEFWVECKFRTSLYDEKLVWSYDEQFRRYKQFQE